MNKEDLQKKAIEFEILTQQFEQLKKQLANFQAQSENIDNLLISLEEVSKTSPDTEILTPLSSGVFIKTKLKENKEVIMATGAQTTVKKPIKEAKSIIQEQKKEIEAVLKQLETDIQNYAVTIGTLQQELSQAQ
tara:strand:- start:37 stop:438 length:402 start_codon:yes stop_codon:yes gene_type:complete